MAKIMFRSFKRLFIWTFTVVCVIFFINMARMFRDFPPKIYAAPSLMNFQFSSVGQYGSAGNRTSSLQFDVMPSSQLDQLGNYNRIFDNAKLLSIKPNPNLLEIMANNGLISESNSRPILATSDTYSNVSSDWLQSSNASSDWLPTYRNVSSDWLPSPCSKRPHPEPSSIYFTIPEYIADLKIFVLDLPSNLTVDLAQCARNKWSDVCVDFFDGGLGRELYQDHDMSIRNSWMWALEVLIYVRMSYSRYRTYNVSEANIIYIPYMASMDCLCNRHMVSFTSKATLPTTINNTKLTMDILQQTLHQRLNGSNPPLLVQTLTRKPRENLIPPCNYLEHVPRTDIQFADISDEMQFPLRSKLMKYKPLIMLPYPAYGHLKKCYQPDVVDANLRCSQRNVLIFMASSQRFTPGHFRHKVVQEFDIITSRHYVDFMKTANVTKYEHIMLDTPECRQDHFNTTYEWMKHSVFCLHPEGDYPERKSFYDSVVSGCIPVIFQLTTYPERVRYPFQSRLNYELFSVLIYERELMDKNITVTEYLRQYLNKPQEVQKLQENLLKVLPYLQYSVVDGLGDIEYVNESVEKKRINHNTRGEGPPDPDCDHPDHVDAFGMFLMELKDVLDMT